MRRVSIGADAEHRGGEKNSIAISGALPAHRFSRLIPSPTPKGSTPMLAKAAHRLPAAFNRLAWSNLAAQSAEQIGLAAAPIVAVLALGADAGGTGLLQTAQTLPFLLLAIPAGMLADRMSRRRLMVSAEALRVVSLIAILALAASGLLTLNLLALLGFIGAC